MTRRIARKVTPAAPQPGFIGEGHLAVHVVEPTDLERTDPFVLLADDRLDIASRRAIGGPHPHAGLETVTLVLQGELEDRDEGVLEAGDVVWMTAGRGIIHNEHVETAGKSRILQLWIALPERERNSAPRFEIIRGEQAIEVRRDGVTGRLYSGTSGGLRSPTVNKVPTTLVDLRFRPLSTFAQELPATFNGFVYVLDGDVDVAGTELRRGDVGWFAPTSGEREQLVVTAGDGGARLVLYAGEPIGEPLVQHGPFVAGTMDEIKDAYRRFRAGSMVPMSYIAQLQRGGERSAI